MGQCGCGDYNGQWRFPGPDGLWYIVGLYQGCKECDNPAGFNIDLLTIEEADEWDAMKLPVIGGPDHPFFGLPCVEPLLMLKELAKELAGAGLLTKKRLDRYDLDEVNAHAAVGSAAWSTVRKFDREIRKNLKKAKASGVAKGKKLAAQAPVKVVPQVVLGDIVHRCNCGVVLVKGSEHAPFCDYRQQVEGSV